MSSIHHRTTEPTPPVLEVDVHVAAALAADGAVMLDVREPFEWASGHIPGAVLMPLGLLDASSFAEDVTIVAVCRSGNRSGRAAAALTTAGFHVVNMVGGMITWIEAGLPTVTEDTQPGSNS